MEKAEKEIKQMLGPDDEEDVKILNRFTTPQ
jgi:hypothetical protein